MRNRNLRNAREAKNDEFYTQLSTIEQEVMHYRKQKWRIIKLENKHLMIVN